MHTAYLFEIKNISNILTIFLLSLNLYFWSLHRDLFIRLVLYTEI